MSDYRVTQADRDAVAAFSTEKLVALVSVQLVQEIVEVMIDELNARYAPSIAAAQEQAELELEFQRLMAEFDLTVEEFNDDDYWS